VPEASIMVVEHAERFGLAQLHQLRGRVGAEPRAPPACSFIRSRSARLRNNVWRRLEPPTTVSSLRRRICGCGRRRASRTKQSGMPDFHFADLTVHGELLAAARDDARLILQRDPLLKSARGEALRAALYLFERDEAVRCLRAG